MEKICSRFIMVKKSINAFFCKILRFFLYEEHKILGRSFFLPNIEILDDWLSRLNDNWEFYDQTEGFSTSQRYAILNMERAMDRLEKNDLSVCIFEKYDDYMVLTHDCTFIEVIKTELLENNIEENKRNSIELYTSLDIITEPSIELRGENFPEKGLYFETI